LNLPLSPSLTDYDRPSVRRLLRRRSLRATSLPHQRMVTLSAAHPWKARVPLVVIPYAWTATEAIPFWDSLREYFVAFENAWSVMKELASVALRKKRQELFATAPVEYG